MGVMSRYRPHTVVGKCDVLRSSWERGKLVRPVANRIEWHTNGANSTSYIHEPGLLCGESEY